jgi:hypothetical protein
VSLAPAAGPRLIRRATVIAPVLLVAVVAPLAYLGWQAVQTRDEALLNCSIAAPRVAGVAYPGGVTFRPAARIASGLTISYTESFDVGAQWTLAWRSDRPGLLAVFLYDATVELSERTPRAANETGQVDFWWNEIVPAENNTWADDNPWTKTIDGPRAGRYCLTILETPARESDWTVTIADRP